MDMWQVQKESYLSQKGLKVGLVARPWGFSDSPDTEYISAGESTKSPDAVALGRHGNFFFWGFAASPSLMTDEARLVFANALVYTASKRGEKVLSRKYEDRVATKSYIKEMKHHLTREAYESRVALEKSHHQQMAETHKKLKEKSDKREELSNNERMTLARNMGAYKQTTWEAYIEKNARMKELKQFGTDVNKMIAFIDENADYLYGGKKFYEFEVDNDAKSLKTSIVDKELLNKAIALWESGKDVAKAKRILDRYTLCAFETAGEWRTWYDTYKDNLFFTQSGGWIYMVDSDDIFAQGNDYRAKAAYVATRDMKFPKLTNSSPVAMQSKLVFFDGGQQGIVTRVKILDSYHIYSFVAEGDAYSVTEFDYTLPAGVTLAEKIMPTDEFYLESGTTRYTKDVIFVQMLDGRAKEGEVTVKCTYQACDANG